MWDGRIAHTTRYWGVFKRCKAQAQLQMMTTNYVRSSVTMWHAYLLISGWCIVCYWLFVVSLALSFWWACNMYLSTSVLGDVVVLDEWTVRSSGRVDSVMSWWDVTWQYVTQSASNVHNSFHLQLLGHMKFASQFCFVLLFRLTWHYHWMWMRVEDGGGVVQKILKYTYTIYIHT